MGKKIKHYVATVYIVQGNNVLLHFHKKLNKWLPPGGHVENNELPDEAAIREVEEETGLKVKIISPKHKSFSGVRSLPLPAFISEEDIGDHYHIDLIYLAKVISGKLNKDFKWFAEKDLHKKEISPDVGYHAKMMLKKFNKQ